MPGQVYPYIVNCNSNLEVEDFVPKIMENRATQVKLINLVGKFNGHE